MTAALALQARRARSVQRGSRAGSVLVPVVAAMLILMMAGVALSEVSAAQRSQRLLSAQSTRAYWIAEAGLWHAAHQAGPIPSPIAFAGGSYVVGGTPGALVATGTLFDASQSVDYPLHSVVAPATSPLDEAASADSAYRRSKDEVRLDLVSVSGSDLEIASFQLDGPDPDDGLEHIKLKKKIWEEKDGVFVPTGILVLNEGKQKERVIPARETIELRLRFENKPSGTSLYTLTLIFTDGSSSVIPFTVEW